MTRRVVLAAAEATAPWNWFQGASLRRDQWSVPTSLADPTCCGAGGLSVPCSRNEGNAANTSAAASRPRSSLAGLDARN